MTTPRELAKEFPEVEVRQLALSDARGQVTFTVSWKSYDGRTQARNYTTYYGEHGLYDYYYNQL